MAEKSQRRGKKKKTAEPESRGLTAKQVAAGSAPAAVEHLRETIAADGGTVLGAYRDPLGGNWQILAALPLDRVEHTPTSAICPRRTSPASPLRSTSWTASSTP